MTTALPHAPRGISEQETYDIARDACVYAYPLLVQYATLRQLSNVAEPGGTPGQAPLNEFVHARAASAATRTPPRANLDALTSFARLDLGHEPVVLSIPATDRWFVLTMRSLWADVFAAPGTRTTGRDTARDFLLVAPRWRGGSPKELEVIRSPTRYATITGWTQAHGSLDHAEVRRVQDGYRLTPLSAWGSEPRVVPRRAVDPRIDMSTPPARQVEALDAARFFARFADLLRDNPPGPHDYPILHRLERVGFSVGRPFDLRAAAPATRRLFERATADGRALVASLGRRSRQRCTNGWRCATTGGSFGVGYRDRAAAAFAGLGDHLPHLPEDVAVASLAVDGDGKALDGGSDYVLHFDKGQLPPADAFWSLTVYDADGGFIPNAVERRCISGRDTLVANPDGSVDLHVQVDSPGGDKRVNWLPVARAPFALMLRLYSPRGEVLDGAWAPPPLRRLSGGRRGAERPAEENARPAPGGRRRPKVPHR